MKYLEMIETQTVLVYHPNGPYIGTWLDKDEEADPKEWIENLYLQVSKPGNRIGFTANPPYTNSLLVARTVSYMSPTLAARRLNRNKEAMAILARIASCWSYNNGLSSYPLLQMDRDLLSLLVGRLTEEEKQALELARKEYE